MYNQHVLFPRIQRNPGGTGAGFQGPGFLSYPHPQIIGYPTPAAPIVYPNRPVEIRSKSFTSHTNESKHGHSRTAKNLKIAALLRLPPPPPPQNEIIEPFSAKISRRFESIETDEVPSSMRDKISLDVRLEDEDLVAKLKSLASKTNVLYENENLPQSENLEINDSPRVVIVHNTECYVYDEEYDLISEGKSNNLSKPGKEVIMTENESENEQNYVTKCVQEVLNECVNKVVQTEKIVKGNKRSRSRSRRKNKRSSDKSANETPSTNHRKTTNMKLKSEVAPIKDAKNKSMNNLLHTRPNSKNMKHPSNRKRNAKYLKDSCFPKSVDINQMFPHQNSTKLLLEDGSNYGYITNHFHHKRFSTTASKGQESLLFTRREDESSSLVMKTSDWKPSSIIDHFTGPAVSSSLNFYPEVYEYKLPDAIPLESIEMKDKLAKLLPEPVSAIENSKEVNKKGYSRRKLIGL